MRRRPADRGGRAYGRWSRRDGRGGDRHGHRAHRGARRAKSRPCRFRAPCGAVEARVDVVAATVEPGSPRGRRADRAGARCGRHGGRHSRRGPPKPARHTRATPNSAILHCVSSSASLARKERFVAANNGPCGNAVDGARSALNAYVNDGRQDQRSWRAIERPRAIRALRARGRRRSAAAAAAAAAEEPRDRGTAADESARSTTRARSSRATTRPTSRSTNRSTRIAAASTAASTAMRERRTPTSTSRRGETSRRRSSTSRTPSSCCAPSSRGPATRSSPIAFGTNTDPYQPVERQLRGHARPSRAAARAASTPSRS